ncbi:MAG: hypothetical protein M3255_10910 [Pseudomonadota bacterium]|jgi:hypothetical protein|nr:hypothetical protein [Pseudomonadota bacterium]
MRAVTQTFFNVVDSPSKAYVLGFFVADGNIHYHHHKIQRTPGYSLSFSSNDNAHLELIRGLLKSEHTIRKHGDNCFQLVIGSKRLVAALANLGYTNRKSYEAHMPQLDSALIPHFVRGVFDGDGCITRAFRAKDRVSYPVVDFNGTERLLLSMLQVLPATSRLKRVKPNLCRLSFSQRKAFSVLDWMYQESTGLRLARKYARYIEAQEKRGFYART